MQQPGSLLENSIRIFRLNPKYFESKATLMPNHPNHSGNTTVRTIAMPDRRAYPAKESGGSEEAEETLSVSFSSFVYHLCCCSLYIISCCKNTG